MKEIIKKCVSDIWYEVNSHPPVVAMCVKIEEHVKAAVKKAVDSARVIERKAIASLVEEAAFTMDLDQSTRNLFKRTVELIREMK